MPDQLDKFQPLDPGRIDATDPLELRYWCTELNCSAAELTNAVAKVGEHVAAVRAQLKLRA
jgi:Protein of unknown function (DUF3606)